jgi:lipoprotein NlpI
MMHENTVDYILGRLSKQDRMNDTTSKFAADTAEAVKVLSKAVISLGKQYKTMTAFTIICVAFGYLGAKKIKELEKELKELKKLKGD